MEQPITFTISQIAQGTVWLAGIVTALTVISNIVLKLFGPVKEMKKQIKSHEDRLEKDHGRLQACEKADVQACRALLALLDHSITGNGIEQLKDAKKDLQRYLTER